MKMTPVEKSSQVVAHGYNPETKTLRIEFKGGGSYDYHDVSADKYADLCKAESIGSHLHAHIKPNFKFKKVEVADGKR